MLTGYEQVRSIVAALSGDREAADRVELLLPKTGVCKVPAPAGASDGQAGCCLPVIEQPVEPVATEASSCAASGCGTLTEAPAAAPVLEEAAASCCAQAADTAQV
jgi:hypothetical protein